MCATPCKSLSKNNLFIAVAVFLGLTCGYLQLPIFDQGAGVVSEIFINLLKLVSLPIIFLSIVATASGMESLAEVRILGRKVVTYTLLTTLMAATVALVLFVTVNPVTRQFALSEIIANHSADQKGYLTYLMRAIPSNVVQPFVEGNVIGVLLLALLFGLAILSLPKEKRETLHHFFSSLYSTVMKVTSWLVQLMPIAVWGFVTLFVKDVQGGLEIKSLALYLCCVVGANLIQAFVVLPVLLKIKGISPYKTAKAMLPALSFAFFSKSSSATLPLAMQCAEERAMVSRRVARFSLPLCTTINMNACAGFILTTVLFVSMSHGIVFSPLEMVSWIFIATLAAVGNAGVPMGCFFLASAFLAAMNLPLNLMGIILPFYTLIDMLETAINVWSDCCVTVVVDRELHGAPVEAMVSS